MDTKPGNIDPNTINVDAAPQGGPTTQPQGGEGGSAGYYPMKVFNAINGLEVGYLASSKNAAVWITQGRTNGDIAECIRRLDSLGRTMVPLFSPRRKWGQEMWT